jgi:hypothetical protein
VLFNVFSAVPRLCPVSVHVAGFAMNLASDGLAADSQWSWHLQMVLAGGRDAAIPTVTHCPPPLTAI